jgi:hypothetical protein
MSKPDRLYIAMYTWTSLIQPSSLSSLLSTFESQDGLEPTHWSTDDPEGEGFTGYQPYSRDSFLAKVSGLREHDGLPGLYRREVPQYTVLLRNTYLNFKSISVDFEKKIRAIDTSEIYAWAGALVSSIDAEVAFIEPAWDNIDYDYKYTTGVRAEDLYSYGLKTLSARTWFGSYLVELIGQERLHNCGGYIQETESGGILLDLVKDPWQTDAQTLTDAQKEIKGNLESTGVFGDYTRLLKLTPGANWSPFPQPMKSL